MARSAAALPPALRAARLAHGFVAGFLATLVFHQAGLALLHRAGLFAGAAWDLRPVPPFGIPSVVSLAFWGGVWGIVFVCLERAIRRCPGGYWPGAILFGAIVPSLVLWFVVAPLKGLPLGFGWPIRLLVVVLIVDGLWGLGTAVFLHLRRGTASPTR